MSETVDSPELASAADIRLVDMALHQAVVAPSAAQQR
jgi:hypothetical protein